MKWIMNDTGETSITSVVHESAKCQQSAHLTGSKANETGAEDSTVSCDTKETTEMMSKARPGSIDNVGVGFKKNMAGRGKLNRVYWKKEELANLTYLYNQNKQMLFLGNMKSKQYAWNRITEKYNQLHPHKPKTMNDLRRRWKNLVYDVRNDRRVDKSIRSDILKILMQKKEVTQMGVELSSFETANIPKAPLKSIVIRAKQRKRKRLKSFQHKQSNEDQEEVIELPGVGADRTASVNDDFSSVHHSESHRGVQTKTYSSEQNDTQFQQVQLDVLKLQKEKLLMEIHKLELEKCVLEKQSRKLDKETLYWQKMLDKLSTEEKAC